MGFFKSLIEGYKLIKEVKATRKEWQRNEKRYLPMTAEEMAALSDEELLLAATTRTNHQAACNGEENGFQQLNEQQKVLYAIDAFEIDVTAQDGGLCDFLSARGRSHRISATVWVPSVPRHTKSSLMIL